ncbi:CPBP family intramembrane glutamic endopeptidase [Lacticaseibacillus porcinae]|uniref:CPBP family intramembrane glutamic endopeptidase n=1 Tax=Lacticaseibacillus porcinae TaxID=1123687 RepID=UPI0013DE24EE|nr:type II CAAX endopeptidase family protein [Lacticaseibacillus porcinae]
MDIWKIIRRCAGVVALFALYMIAEMIVMIPTVATNGKASSVLVALVFAIVFGSLIYLLATTYRYYLRPDPEGFEPHAPMRETWVFMGKMVLALVVVQVLSGIAISLHWTAESQNQDALMQVLQQAPLTMVLIAVVGAPPIEELLFRGLLMHSFGSLKDKRRLWAASIISSVVFGLMHAGPSEPLNMISYIAMGAIFTATYVKTKDIRYSIALHFLNNFVALML